LAGAVLLGGHDPGAAQVDSAKADGFISPGGFYRVRFTEVAHRRFTAEQALRELDNVDHVEYTLTFVHAEDGHVRAEASYADVYGWEPSRGPTDPALIVSWLDWSPGEDFVILPSEGWASAPGTPERAVLALADTLGWSRGSLAMDTLIWASPLVAVGDQHSDCDYSVDAFDGATGLSRPLDRPPESPLGWEIHEVEERTIVVRSALDNCASEVERARFEPECRAVDLDTFQARAVACARESLDRVEVSSAPTPPMGVGVSRARIPRRPPP
jgi:hypothetical protein